MGESDLGNGRHGRVMRPQPANVSGKGATPEISGGRATDLIARAVARCDRARRRGRVVRRL